MFFPIRVDYVWAFEDEFEGHLSSVLVWSSSFRLKEEIRQVRFEGNKICVEGR